MKIKINGKMVECRRVRVGEKLRITDVYVRDGMARFTVCDGIPVFRHDQKPYYRPLRPKPAPKRSVKAVECWCSKEYFEHPSRLYAPTITLDKHYTDQVPVTITLRKKKGAKK